MAEGGRRFLYVRNGVLGGGDLLGTSRSSRVPSLIAAATGSAEDPGYCFDGLLDCCLFGMGYSFRKDGNGDETGVLNKSGDAGPNCRLSRKMFCKVSVARCDGDSC